MKKYLLIVIGTFLLVGCSSPIHQPSTQQIINDAALEQARQKCGVASVGMSEKQRKKVYSCIDAAFKKAGGRQETSMVTSAISAPASADPPERRIERCKMEVGEVVANPFGGNPNEYEANKLRKRACEFLPYDTKAYLELERQASALLAAGNPSSGATTRCKPDFTGGMICTSQ